MNKYTEQIVEDHLLKNDYNCSICSTCGKCEDYENYYYNEEECKIRQDNIERGVF